VYSNPFFSNELKRRYKKSSRVIKRCILTEKPYSGSVEQIHAAGADFIV
jgi:hypothetical protein